MTIESTTTLYRDREIHPSVKFAVHDEACRVVDVKKFWQEVVDYFSPTALNPHQEIPFLLSKTTSKRLLARKRRQLGLILTSRHCMTYDVIMCSLENSISPTLDRVFLTLETGLSANFDVRRNVVPPWRVRKAHSGSNSPMTSQNVNAKQSRKVVSSGRFRHILHIFGQEWEK